MCVSVCEPGGEITERDQRRLFPQENCEVDMNGSMYFSTPHEEDGLRLLALSRIPQCSVCPRLDALRANHGSGKTFAVPDAPRDCKYRYCKPLMRRYGGRAVEILKSDAGLPAIDHSSRPQASTATTS
jgi:hypothetical protein